jgi:hypothetical protein
VWSCSMTVPLRHKRCCVYMGGCQVHINEGVEMSVHEGI